MHCKLVPINKFLLFPSLEDYNTAFSNTEYNHKKGKNPNCNHFQIFVCICEIQLATIGALKSYKDYDKDCKTYSQGIGK